jgi:transglutaminase-like putative cysteine protease
MKDNRDLSIYLEPTYFIDSDSPAIIAYASATCHGKDTDIDRAIALYYGVRDDIRYDPTALRIREKLYEQVQF